MIVLVLMPAALSSIMIDPGSTAIEITGATSASSQASSALSTSSFSTTSGHCVTPCPVWFCNSRLVQNSINRETLEGDAGKLLLDFVASRPLGLCHNL